MYEKKLHFVSLREISSVACGFSPIKIHFSDYPRSLISKTNEVYVFFDKDSLKLNKKQQLKLHLYNVNVCFAAITLNIVLTWFL